MKFYLTKLHGFSRTEQSRIRRSACAFKAGSKWPLKITIERHEQSHQTVTLAMLLRIGLR